MKKTHTSCLFFISITFLIFYNTVTAQETKNPDAYQTEVDGYFANPVVSAKGVIVTNNSASKLFLIKNTGLIELIAAPGCGRYFNISTDKSTIGFKLIKPDGMQVPALYNLDSMKITELSVPVDLCGQVSFSANEKVAFTIANILNVIDNNICKTYNLGTYSNIAPISPDGNYVIFTKDDSQLYMINLLTNVVKRITDNLSGYAYPQWSPDGNKVSFASLSGTITVWDKISNATYSIGTGENARWSDDSEYIYYNVLSNENLEFKGSEIFRSRFDGTSITQLTNTKDTDEMFPFAESDSSIIYCTYNKREIIRAKLNADHSIISKLDTLIKAMIQMQIEKNETGNFSQKSSKSITMLPGDVPYVSQRWDTPDWHAGSGSCAPTTAVMAFAYYNRLPYWDIICASNPTSHMSHYGAYVADKYRYNELYYDTYADAYGTDAYGGYGYMWGLGSPSSYMATYIQNHGFTSVKSATTTFQNVVDEIDAGYPFSICNLLSSAGHLTLTVGYVNGQHTLIFNDPYGDKNLGSWGSLNNGKNSYYDWPGYNNGYQNLNTMAWTVTSETSEPIYNDTIIDDIYYNHGFYMNNQSPSHMKFYRDTKLGGYNDHFWYTYTSTSTTVDTCWVKWTPNIPVSGNYEVSAYIPTINASATTARYKVFFDGGNQTVVINQAPIYGQWVSLGIFPFSAGNSGYVRLGDGSGMQSQKIAFDAMKWVYAGTITSIEDTDPEINFSISPNPATGNLTITSNTTGSSDVEIEIYDLPGKLFLSKQIILDTSTPQNIDISGLPSALYLLRITSEGKSCFRKVSVY